MNEKGKTTLDTSFRMKKDKNFKNIILKNCCRLRQKSTDSHNSRALTESNLEQIQRKTNYNKIQKNNFIESNDNISIESIPNVNKKYSIKRKFFLDFNCDKKPPSNVEKEIIKENKIINKSINDIKKIRVNQIKIKTINGVDTVNNIKTENNFERKIMRKNTNDVEFYYNNSNIKKLINDLKDNKNNTERKRSPNWKRSDSIGKIMKTFFYSSYITDIDKSVNKEKPKLLGKMNQLNKIKNNNYLKEKDLLLNNKQSLTKNINFNLTNENRNFNNIKIKNNKNLKYKYNTNKEHIYINKKFRFGNNKNNNKDIYTFSTEDNSFLINDENKDTMKNNSNNNMFKVKMIYYKPVKKNIIQEIKTNSINQINKSPSDADKINLDDNNISKKYKIKRLDNLISPNLKYPYKRRWNFINKDIDIINTNKKNHNHYDILEINSNYNTNEKNYSNINSIRNMDKETENVIVNFFDDIIDLCNGIKQKTIFEILINKINKKYFIDYDKISFETNLFADMKENFKYCFKYFCLILICFCFLSKEDILYTDNVEKINSLFIQYIYSSLCFIGYQNLNSKNIKRFLKDYILHKKVSIIQCTNSIINVLFEEKEEYNSIYKILKQLIESINTKNLLDIIKIINQTILFCFNKMPYNKTYLNKFQGYKLFNSFTPQKLGNNNIKSPSIPYIKTNLRKQFCLVLDLDETIIHSVKLNYGNYFFLRPGTIELLKELSHFYEIIIFTSSPKEYADDILDKIDSYGNLIAHRLYKYHVLFEKGKSVKKLELIGRDLNKIIFVDNLKCNAKYNMKNLYLIPTWTDDIYDSEIYKLKNKLKYIYESGKFNNDVTKGL